MKLEPIINPHSRIGQIAKKTKAEEKDELIATTKNTVIDKYAKKNASKKQGQSATVGSTGQVFQEKSSFQLAEKVTKESKGVKLLAEGYMQAYIDFFYLTTETTPSFIEPSDKLVKEY